ncbi:phosphotransferase family protein [Hirschia maritima]|uniref:phosphotransferase family protein n=1 Tax=Hirschia maritima TaxID=1121961 RepID=UPI0003AA9A92|nr:aminoglycoside phosphotransferase family protein [Hirschia maritima]
MSRDLKSLCEELVVELKLGQPSDIQEIRPLTGGVASDIALVEIGETKYCMKFAREKLQVAEDWFAPLHRNAAEYAWLKFASSVCEEGAVALFGQSEALNGFAMEFVSGENVYLWKDHLLDGIATPADAVSVARCLGQIQSASTAADFDRSKFENQDDFRALRLEPYLTFLVSKHLDLKALITEIETTLYESSKVLVHGDVSPKNIMFKNGQPILLDAECATLGDASFDPAFCMNHLILKAAYLPDHTDEMLGLVDVFWGEYSSCIDWEDEQALEKRICALLPILMLARVDGKSPVEYLKPKAQAQVRALSISLIQNPKSTISEFLLEVKKGLV